MVGLTLNAQRAQPLVRQIGYGLGYSRKLVDGLRGAFSSAMYVIGLSPDSIHLSAGLQTSAKIIRELDVNRNEDYNFNEKNDCASDSFRQEWLWSKRDASEGE